MPIILENLDQNASVITKALSAQFFSTALTGSGGKIGLLNGSFLPARDAATAKISPQKCRNIKSAVSSGTADYEFIPTMLLTTASPFIIKKLPEMATCVSNDTVSDDHKVYMMVTMHDMVLCVTDKNTTTKKRELFCMYDIAMISATSNPDEFKCEVFTEPCLNVQQFANNNFIDPTLLDEYFGSLLVYDIVINTVEVWTSHIPAIVKTLIDNNMTNYALREMCIRLNNYSVNLTDYKEIYDYVYANRPDAIDEITQVNLNLLLNATLKTLEQNKANIPTFNAQPWNPPALKLSNEQVKAVCTTEPCCIVQAGAGTGKSTVINNRINYLKHCGVDLGNVMVLSFTNAAADHIKDIAPEVNSKTIASMIHDIYAMNFEHNLSTVDTMLNILRATKSLNQNRVALTLINALKSLKKDTNTGLIDLSNLISNHFDEVIAILDTIKQTTLELESIICYHAKNLTEPNGLCKHLIMDEVQDNSIFEFIYIINYVVRHNSCLYLVGDCSQTLYEFRASNPKALNCLEMSGVFECMQLQTNYRSNQNILDFANLTLNTIEANQFAKIQLHANNFQRRPFAEDVIVKYTRLLNKTTALEQGFTSMLFQIKDWIQDKFDKGEQVAFLSYKRNDLDRFEKVATIMFPNNSLVNTTPTKCFNNCFFSKYILYLGDDFSHNVGSDVTVEIMRHIIDNIDRLCKNDGQKNTIKTLINEWQKTYRNTFILRDASVSANGITNEEFVAEVFQSLIDFEIEKNAMKQRLVSAANEKMKAADISDYDFVVSTIHSAKGLEFDNVILLYDESRKNEEEDKRMYYVGLTRAKNAECILAFDTRVNSDILAAYELMCQAHAPQAAQQSDDDNADTSDEDVTASKDETLEDNGTDNVNESDGND